MTDEKLYTEIFGDIYEKYSKYIFNWFKKDFGIEDAEDLTQQTFLQLWAWIPNKKEIKNKKALIFKIAKNIRMDKYRKNALSIESTYLPELYEIADRNDETSIVDIKLSISKLSVKEQQLLHMKLQGLTSEQIGKEFGITASSVRTRLQKIRSKLK